MQDGRRLLIVTTSAYTFGGVQHWLSYIVPGLESLGWDVTVGLTSGPRYHCPEKFLAEIPFRNTCVIHTDTCTPESRAKAVMRVVMECKPDLVMGVNVADTYEGCRRARLRGWSGKMVMSLHGLEPGYYKDLHHLVAHLDTAIGVNRLACLAMNTEGGFPEERISYAPVGVEIHPVAIRRRTNKQLVLAYSGRFEKIPKRVDDIPRILAALADRGVSVTFLVAGSGPEEDGFLRACRAVDAHRVEMLGCLPAQELGAKLYRRADILLITSSWETGPIVAWEAMASGTVVVSSRYTGCLAEAALVDSVNCRLFDVGNVEQAADCIAELDRDREQLALLAAGGRQLVESRYTRLISIEAMDGCLRQIVARSPLPPCGEPVWRHQPAGRLDRWVGQGMGESLRSVLGKKVSAAGPGSEWPHAYCQGKEPNDEFMKRLEKLEQIESPV